MQRYLGLNWKFLTFLEIETMQTLLLCFFFGGFVLGCSFGCGVTLWAAMDRDNKACKASPELMAMQEAYRD
jgi:hypothetical protein